MAQNNLSIFGWIMVIITAGLALTIRYFCIYYGRMCCRWCCDYMCQTTDGPSVTTVTTTQHTQSPQVVPPYPIDARHPVPSSNITGYGNQAPYPQYPFNTGHYRQLSYPSQFSTWSPGCRPMSMTIPTAVPTPTLATLPYFQTGPVSPPMAGATPYPPQPYQQAAHDYSANPPPYDVAVSQPPLQPPPSKEGYVKQSPYNPGYN